MTFDLILVAGALVFGVLGFLSGFAMQALLLVLLLIAYLCCGLIGRPLGIVLAEQLEIQPLLGQSMGAFIAFSLLFLLFSSIGVVVVRRSRRFKNFSDLEHKRGDRLWGAGLGFLTAFMIFYLLLCTAVLVESKVSLDEARLDYGESFLKETAKNYNLITVISLPYVADLNTLMKKASAPDFRQRSANIPSLGKLLAHPKISRLLDNRFALQSLEQNDFGALVANPQFNDASQDLKVQKLLSEIDWGTIE